MLCSRCGLEGVPPGAAFCPRCGTPLGGSAGLGSMVHRREAAVAAFEAGRDAAGVQCPNCGAYRMQAVRIDADGTLIFGFIALVIGIATLVLVLVFGDTGLYVSDASALAVVLVAVGLVLLLVARYRRRPRAFECFACGYRVP
jgi:hypothetical protein